MTDEDVLKKLRTRITSAQQEEARAEVALENAKQALATAMGSLKEEFGSSSVDEAQELLKVLESKLDKAVKKIDSSLSKLGA